MDNFQLRDNQAALVNVTIIASFIKMNTQDQIKAYINSQPPLKRADMETLHQRILKTMPQCKIRFLDGRDEKGKIVSNPNIGYGSQEMKYADGKTREFYQVGMSANTSGLSVYIMGLEDKKYLPDTYGKSMGKAVVTGYCVKFKTLKDINVDTLETAIKDAVSKTS